MPGDFHNPYGFVPPTDPKGAGAYNADTPDEHSLGQGRPPGHDRYRPGLWSGRIGIAIEAATPLLIPEAVPVGEIGADKHKIFRTRRAPGAADTPLLPVTSFKGPLRSAYEAITNSRLGVLRGHRTPLARRMDAEEGLSLVPARLVEAGGQKSVELWLGTRKTLPGQAPLDVEGAFPTTYAAWLPMWRNGYVRGFASHAQHGDEVICRLQRVEHTAWRKRQGQHQRDFDFWEVVTFRKASGAGRLDRAAQAAEINGKRREGRSIYRPVGDPIMARGFIVATGRNFGRKHDERVFFLPDGEGTATPINCPITNEESERLAERWAQLVDESQGLHAEAIASRRERREPPEEYFDREPGRTAYSRHVLSLAERQLTYGTLFSWDNDEHRPGTLCYARVQHKGKKPIIDALFPVMIGRELGNWSPAQMLQAELRPALRVDELSPADRVFGWVRDESANQVGGVGATSGLKPPAAWKGQLRIAPIRCEGVYDPRGAPLEENGRPASAIQAVGDENGLPLAILSTPKPSQARFYAARDQKGTPFDDGADLRQRGYFERRTPQTPQAGLRGRKVYPHHRAASAFSDYWSPASAWDDARAGNLGPVAQGSGLYREYVRRAKPQGQPERDGQNRSIRDWVRPGTRFVTHIDVVNLNAAELGALLWLLDLGRKRQGQPDAHLRLGGGKPLGFGSVRVSITSLDLADGEAKRQEYRSFLDTADPERAAPDQSGFRLIAVGDALDRELTAPGGPVTVFKAAMEAAYGNGNAGSFCKLPAIEAFLVAARGFTDGLPLHYPRTQASPHPDGLNYEWFVRNQRQHGGKLALPDISTDKGLPRKP